MSWLNIYYPYALSPPCCAVYATADYVDNQAQCNRLGTIGVRGQRLCGVWKNCIVFPVFSRSVNLYLGEKERYGRTSIAT